MEKKGRAKGGGSSDADRASNLKEYALMDEALRRLAFSEYVPLKEDQQREGGADAKARPKMRKGRKQLPYAAFSFFQKKIVSSIHLCLRFLLGFQRNGQWTPH